MPVDINNVGMILGVFMLKGFFKKVQSLEEMLVECSEMSHFSAGISSMLTYKNEAYLQEKANEEKVTADISACEMYRYLTNT